MKRAILGLAALVASNCSEPIDERAIKKAVRECNIIPSSHRVAVVNLDNPEEYGYLTPEQIARVGKVLEDKTDCHLSVYEDTFNKSIWSREFVVQKNDSTYDMGSFQPPRYKKLYPSHK